MIRAWHKCFLFTLVVFLLQLFPYTGIFLMMMAAPLWSVISVNLGFGLMAVDVWRGNQPRWLILFPILWFGGYLVIAAFSHWQVYRFGSDLNAGNAGLRIPFDPSKQDVVLASAPRSATYSSDLTTDGLIRSFGLIRAYEDRRIDGGPPSYREHILSGAACPTGSGTSLKHGKIWQGIHRGGYGSGEPMLTAENLCLISGPGVPEKPVVHVQLRAQVKRDGLLADFTTQDIIVTPPSGQAVRLRSGWGQALSWYPKPIVGCWLNSGAPAWECEATFARESLYGKERDKRPYGADDVVGRLLGLQKGSIEDRYPDARWR